jgi:ubiquinone/menaquinone biosynthesis C-methylase UbiE
VAVDESPDMLEAARRRVESPGSGTPDAGTGSVELKEGRLEALPLGDASLDVALLFLVLHYVAEPARALAEARRVLRPGGRLLVVDMVAHGRSEYRDRMGHLWLGFERGQVEGWLEAVGFGQVGYHHVPTDASAKGPMLFAAVAAASAEKRSNNVNRRPAE